MPREAVVAILFADVASSTQLYETFGDIRANKIVGSCLHAMAEAATQHSGSVVKTIGDESMCSFPTAQQAALAAISMQDRLAGAGVGAGLSIAIRIGFHAGPPCCRTTTCSAMSSMSRSHGPRPRRARF